MILQCNKYRILIHKQLDGRATELEIRQLRQHLDTCPNCSRYQEETTALMESLRLTPLPRRRACKLASPSGFKISGGSHLPASPLSQQGFCWGAVVSRPAVSSSFSFSWASIFFPFLPTFMNIYHCSSAIFLYPLNLGSAVCGTSGRGFHHYNLEVSLCNTPIVFCFLSRP